MKRTRGQGYLNIEIIARDGMPDKNNKYLFYSIRNDITIYSFLEGFRRKKILPRDSLSPRSFLKWLFELLRIINHYSNQPC